KGKYRLNIDRELPSPYVTLNRFEPTRSGYLACLSSNSRSPIRRAYRYVEEYGEIVLTAATSLACALEWLDALAVLHQKRWEAVGKPGSFASSFFMNFHKQLIKNRWAAGEI